ncbi:MAG: trypsin-like peptidase domain-containing protein [Chthoniobacteraceae bacterium]|jgi:serine protease Do
MSLRRASNIATAALAAALLAFPGGLCADPLSDEVQAIFQRCSKAVVKIEAEDDDGQLSGTGFFVDPNGTIYTNYSVGGESHDIVVSDGAARYPASRIAADPRSGLAILKIDGTKTPFLPLGKSSDLQVASMVMAIGYPLDLPVTPNVGCVGGFSISSGDRVFAVSHIRANVAVERGEGGAPLLDMNGQVVGILESSLDGGAGCFALPIEAAEKVYGDVMHFGGVRPGWLGIRFDDSGSDPSKIKVQGFIPGGPAEKSGVQPGDVIVKVGDHPVSTFDDIMNAAFYLTAGEEVPVTVSRAGQPVEIKIVPAPNPLAPQQEMVPASVFSLSVRLGN